MDSRCEVFFVLSILQEMIINNRFSDEIQLREGA